VQCIAFKTFGKLGAILLGVIVDEAVVWVFGFWSLEFVFDLCFVIWIFSARAYKANRNIQNGYILVILGNLGISQYLLHLLHHLLHIGAVLADNIEGVGKHLGA